MEEVKRSPIIKTIGHSTRTIDEFIHLLQLHEITLVVDVRSIPRSRHNPQFNKDNLSAYLKNVNIGYVHMMELGGLRHPSKNSPNTAWRNASFRGYADYMQTPQFQSAIEKLISMAHKDRITLMCAEVVPWRCHRSLIADALLIRGIPCEDVINEYHSRTHTLTSFAKVDGTQITYP
ncbi:MAG: DUF488 domain-containing protein [Fibrobacter sp.]|jgi:uncharacterized protein (DUF488 family)|nr:DUF488 domain-containing protein [Fibrobacter sp.]